MVTVFDFLNDIITTKKGNLLDNIDNENQFNLYMICRWLSMYSPAYAQLINETVNQYYTVFNTKQEWYDFLVKIIPRGHSRGIRYIKKQKKPPIDNFKGIVKFLATRFELSQREITQYLESGKIDITKLKTVLK